MAVNNPDDAQHVREIQSLQRRRLYELEKQATIAGITVEPRVLMEIEDLRRSLGILDRVRQSSENWSGDQVALVLELMSASNYDRQGRWERRLEGVEEGLQSLVFSMRVQLVIEAALIIVVILLQTWGK